MSMPQQYGGDPSATVHLVRQPSYSAGAVPFVVKIDGVEYAKIRPNERLRLPVVPGDHRIQLTMWSGQGSETLFFRAQPGEDIAFTCQGTMRLLRPIDLHRDGAVPQAGPSDHVPAQTYPAPFQFSSAQPSPTAQPIFPPPSFQAQPPVDAAPPTFAAPEPGVVEVRETGQFEEPLGEEVRVIDNRHSATGLTRSVKASREWSRTLTVGGDQKRTLGAEIGGGPSWLRAKGSIEAELQRTYSVETGTRHMFEEEITITVPARTTVRLVLQWKRIWQRGVVVLAQGDGTTAEVPYQVVVNVTFDQSLRDTDVEPWTVPPLPDGPATG